MSIAEELELLVGKLNKTNGREAVCDEARHFLSSVEPDELRKAERELMNKGVPVENLNRLCSIHLDLFDGSKVLICAAGSEIIDVLFHEHEVILDMLEELESVGHMLQSRNIEDLNSREIKKLPGLLDSLTHIESHLRREEKVVFPELRSRCSPEVLAAEHQRIFAEIDGLSRLIGGSMTDLERFKQKAVISINAIVPVWWQHIFKENNILFPSFLDDVKDEKRLVALKSLCDEIGYFDLALSK